MSHVNRRNRLKRPDLSIVCGRMTMNYRLSNKFLSSCQEKTTLALFFGQIAPVLAGVDHFQVFRLTFDLF